MIRFKQAGKKVVLQRTGVREASRRLVRGPAIWQVLRKNRGSTVLQPELYLQAAGEAFLSTLALSWIVSAIGNPGAIESNRIHDIFAYNNVCVGFDSTPARYFALPLFVVQAYFGLRYASLDQLRAELERRRRRISACQYGFSLCMNTLYCATMLFWPMLLIVTPDAGGAGLNAHFYIYVLFVVVMYLTVVAHFVESSYAPASRLSLAWVSVWGVWTLLLLLIGFLGFNGYDYAACPSDSVPALKAAGTYAALCLQDPHIPVPLMAALDYGWFVLLCLSTPLLPYAPPLNLAITLVDGGPKGCGSVVPVASADAEGGQGGGARDRVGS